MKKFFTRSVSKICLFAFLLMQVSAGIRAQTRYYVSNMGSDSFDGLTPATAKATIQAAVAAAGDGAVIHIANGNYILAATLYLNHEMALEGESEAGVIINTTGTPPGAWAISPNKSNTALLNFTIVPNGTNGGYPIHVGANTGNPLPVLSNILLQHITIQGAKKTAFDCNAVDHLSLRYLTATHSQNGNGIQVSGCKYVSAGHLTTNQNAWGGFAVYVSKPYPSGVGRGSDQVFIDANSSSLGESVAVYSQDESGLFNKNITVNGLDYLVSNPASKAGFGFYYRRLSIATAAALALPNPVSSLIKQVSANTWLVVPGMRIQAAVNNAEVNSVVQVMPGIYHEDVIINKTMTLQGAGRETTTLYGLIGGGGAAIQIGANHVIIDGFGISRDGNNITDWNNPGLNFAGIAIATVGNAEIRDCNFFGNRTGIDVNNSSGNYIHNNIISANRTGLLFRNQTDNTRVIENQINHNWTLGILFLDASNGTNVPVQSAANSTFANNYITGNWYGQVEDLQSGGSLPAPGNNLKNFSCNWYGSMHPVVATARSAEPGYAALIPVVYGGTASAPGGHPDILGSASANITALMVNNHPAPLITVSGPDAFCNVFTASVPDAGPGSLYCWMLESVPFANTPSIHLDQTATDGLYSVTVITNGCPAEPSTYLYQKQQQVSSYTLLALKKASLGENNTVASGSVGVVDKHGQLSLHKNSSVNSSGAFVKAARIRMEGQNIRITQPVYAAAAGIILPVMYENQENIHRLPNRIVVQNSVSTVSGNYRNLFLEKGSRTTLTGNTFGTIQLEPGAQLSFTDNTLHIDRLQVQDGYGQGYSYVRFAPDTRVLVSGSVTIGSRVYVNPDNYRVTFYLDNPNPDAERFLVTGSDTRITANIYIPDGKLKVAGGYGYHEKGNGHDDDDHDEPYFGKGNGTVYMTGLFIAAEVESTGKNVIWNSFDCNAAPVPVPNTAMPVQATQSVTTESQTIGYKTSLSIQVLPNPSSNYFTLRIVSQYATPVLLRVTDAVGRVVDAKSQIHPNSTLQIGQNYRSGTYYAQVIQGNRVKLVQLIKLNH